jgi:hypothetical protein
MSPSGKPGGKAPRPFMDPGVAEATPSLYFSYFFFFAPLPALLLLGSPRGEGREGSEEEKKKKEEKEKSSRPELPG